MGSVRNGYRERLVVAVDVGSTIIRCHVYNSAAEICGSAEDKIKVLYPCRGHVELDPEVLWGQFVTVVKEAIKDGGVHINQIAGLGISTQRATFITWDKKTGKPFHNFISWQDLRAAELVNSWNSSLLLKAVHGSCKFLHFFTQRKRFLAASLINFTTQHVSLRLVWVLQNIPEVQQAADEGNCCFGTIDTWLLYKLTEGSVHATDYSNASGTGIFDPYLMSWSSFLCSLMSIPLSIFPPVEDTRFTVNDPYACASFMGLKPSTSKCHLVRAILESVAFRNKQLYDTMRRETSIKITNIRADGGVSSNSFIMQMTADLLGQSIDKPKHTDMSSLGAAFLAGLGVGIWSSKEELKKLRQAEVIFEPQRKFKDYEKIMAEWELALQRCSNWYK